MAGNEKEEIEAKIQETLLKSLERDLSAEQVDLLDRKVKTIRGLVRDDEKEDPHE